jgi:1,4-dihydroxy-2-naphthoyl-CoA hydrolase
MAFVYQRTIHFPDTDAAGVVFFPNYLSICHEAYEESLAAAGVPIRTFFSANKLIVPISKSSAEYLRPLFCGDKISVTLKAKRLTPDTYAIDFEMTRQEPKPSKPAATVRTCHVCIRADTRERTPIPPELAAWIDSTSA